MLTFSTHALVLNKFDVPPAALGVNERAGLGGLELCEARLRGTLAAVRFEAPPGRRTLGAVPRLSIGAKRPSIVISVERPNAVGRLPDAEGIGRATATVSAPQFRRPVTESDSIVVGRPGNDSRLPTLHEARLVLRHSEIGGESK
jgi:hypothetical protein